MVWTWALHRQIPTLEGPPRRACHKRSLCKLCCLNLFHLSSVCTHSSCKPFKHSPVHKLKMTQHLKILHGASILIISWGPLYKSSLHRIWTDLPIYQHTVRMLLHPLQQYTNIEHFVIIQYIHWLPLVTWVSGFANRMMVSAFGHLVTCLDSNISRYMLLTIAANATSGFSSEVEWQPRAFKLLDQDSMIPHFLLWGVQKLCQGVNSVRGEERVTLVAETASFHLDMFHLPFTH